MKSVIRKKRTFQSVFLLSFLSFFVSFAQAQQAPTLIWINQVQLKPTMQEAFLELHRNVYSAQAQAEGAPWRLVQTTVLGDSWQAAVAIPLPNGFASMSNMSAIQTDATQTLFSSAVESRRSFVIQAREELGIPGGDGVKPLRRLVRIEVKPGMNAAFEEFWLDTIRPAMENSGIVGYQVFQTIMGGPQGEYYGALWIDSPADLDGLNVLSSLSPREATELQEEFGSLVNAFEVNLVAPDIQASFGLPGL